MIGIRAVGIRAVAVPCLLILTLGGCQESLMTPPVEGTFEGALSGGLSLELQGTAWFGVFPGEGFGVVLLSGGVMIAVARRVEERPDAGSYTLGEPDAQGGYYGVVLIPGSPSFTLLTTGTGDIVFERSTRDWLEGTLVFESRGLLGGDPAFDVDVSVSATFLASCRGGATCD